MQNKLKHLEFIQGVINRLSTNSFQLKGWAVVLVSAILVLLFREGRTDAALVAVLPILVFWGLDGYFLWQERLFRTHYDRVRVLPSDDVDFSMDVRMRKGPLPHSWFRATLSRTLVLFYGTLLVVALITFVAFRFVPDPEAGPGAPNTSVPENG